MQSLKRNDLFDCKVGSEKLLNEHERREEFR